MEFEEIKFYKNINYNDSFNWKNEKEKLLLEYDFLINDLISEITNNLQNKLEKKRVKDKLDLLLNYNCKGGKMIRALIVVYTYKLINSDIDSVNLQKIRFLGITIEILQTAFLIADDIIDNSHYRRDKICWYKCDNIGFTAINDAYLLESCVYIILRKYFKSHKNYINLFELFHDVSLKTEIGQIQDILTDNINQCFDINYYTKERLESIAINKTAYYTFYLPIMCTLYFSNINLSANLIKDITEITNKFGILFQAQDDFLDCFGNKKKIGKESNDIECGKCTWLIVNALDYVNSKQKEYIIKNYGKKNNNESINIIKNIYEEINMIDKFNKYKIELSQNIKKKIILLEKNYENKYISIDLLEFLINRIK